VIFFILVQTRTTDKPGFDQNIYTASPLLALHPPSIQPNRSWLKKPRHGVLLPSMHFLPFLLVQHIKSVSVAKAKYLLLFANQVDSEQHEK